MRRNPYAPIVCRFDVQALADSLGIPCREVPMDQACVSDGEITIEPMKLPKGLDAFIDFRYGTKR